MKRIFTLTISTVFSIITLAQVPSNGDFSNWHSSGKPAPFDWEEPDDWSSSNPLSEFIGAGVEKGSQGVTGLACELTTLDIFSEDAPAFIVNGDVEYDLNTFMPDFKYSGTPVSSALHYLHGSYTYSSNDNTDSAFVAVAYKKWNQSKGAADTIAEAFILLPQVANFTEFQVDISHVASMDVDSVVIIIVSTNPNNIKSGGKLTIDDLSMDMINSTNNIATSADIKIYPNPATDIVNVTVGNNEFVSHINIVDLTGKIVTSTDYYNTSEAKLEVADFKTGIYFVQVTTDKGIITRKLSVEK